MQLKFRFTIAVAVTLCCTMASSLASEVKKTAGKKPTLTLSHQATASDWPQPVLLIPQLPEAPQIDGTVDTVWQHATPASIAYPLGSKEAVAPDTHFRIGHRDGTLHLLLQYDWPQDKPIPSATENAGALWSDDGAEIFFTRLDRLGITRQLIFNLSDVRMSQDVYVDTAHYHFADEVAGLVPSEWTMKTGRTGSTRTLEMAVSLSSVLGIKGEIGEAFRFNVISNRRDKGIIHWSPTEGFANARPSSNGFAVLAGPASQEFDLTQLGPDNPTGLMLTARPGAVTALTGYPLKLTVANPLTSVVPDAAYSVAVHDKSGRAVLKQQLKLDAWPQTFVLQPGILPAGNYTFRVQSAANKALMLDVPIAWQPSIAVEAEDGAGVRYEGKDRRFVVGYPRGVGTDMLFSSPQSKITVSNYGTAVYMKMGPILSGPGPSYGSYADAVMRCKVDNRPWRNIRVIENAQEIPLAENLPLGLHTVTVELGQGIRAPIDKFLFSVKPLAGVKGIITSQDYNEVMTDARADIYRGSQLVRSEYIRNPINGRFVILGLEPGTYRIRFSASGWLPQEVKDISVRRDGERVDLGVVALSFDKELEGEYSMNRRNGKSANVQPGGSFTVAVSSATLKKVELVSRYKTIELKVNGPAKIVGSGTGSNKGISLTVPEVTPHDMYSLRCTYQSARGEWVDVAPQAVCVREPLPESFAVAGMGHMNTWGQQTSEYLAKVTQMAQLAGARTILISNEVNAAYIAGALKELTIPYLITSGNHTMARWNEFFGPHSHAYDDGPMRIVTFSSHPSSLWQDPAYFLNERPEATNRVLLCYESHAPLELIQSAKVDMLFDAHSLADHADRARFPAGTLHVAATDFQTMRWIPMTHNGLDPGMKIQEDAPSLIVPRVGPAPLRVEYENRNDGIHNRQTARVINRYSQRFPHARLRLVLKAGDYKVTGGKVMQSFLSDDGKLRIIDVEADVAPNSETTVQATQQ